MLKISGSIKSLVRLGEGGVEVNSFVNKARCDGKCMLNRSKIGVSKIDSDEIEDNKSGKKVQKCLSSKNCLSPKRQ